MKYLDMATQSWLSEILVISILGTLASIIPAALLWIVLVMNVDPNLEYTLVWKWTWVICSILFALESLSDHISEARDDHKLSRKWNIPMTEIFYARTELGIFLDIKQEEILKWTKEKFITEVNAKMT